MSVRDDAGVRWVVMIAAMLFLTGCGWPGTSASGDQRESDLLILQAIDRANSPIVADLTYNEADYVDEASISVWLRGEPSSDEVRNLVCEIIVPVLRQHRARESLDVSVWDGHRPTPRLVGSDLMPCQPG